MSFKQRVIDAFASIRPGYPVEWSEVTREDLPLGAVVFRHGDKDVMFAPGALDEAESIILTGGLRQLTLVCPRCSGEQKTSMPTGLQGCRGCRVFLTPSLFSRV